MECSWPGHHPHAARPAGRGQHLGDGRRALAAEDFRVAGYAPYRARGRDPQCGAQHPCGQPAGRHGRGHAVRHQREASTRSRRQCPTTLKPPSAAPAANARTGKLVYPTSVPLTNVPKPDLPGTPDGAEDAYTAYPTQRSTLNLPPPGKGGTLSAFVTT